MILTRQEHEKVMEGVNNGSALVLLREGALGINPKFIRKFGETYQPTDIQSRNNALQRIEAPKPATEKRGEGFVKVGDHLTDSHFEFYERMGWKHAEDCVCRKDSFGAKFKKINLERPVDNSQGGY